MIDSGQEVRWGASADLRTIAKNFKHELPVPLADAIAGWLFDHVFPWVEHYAITTNLAACDRDELIGMIRKSAERGNAPAQRLLADVLGLFNEQTRDKDLTPADIALAGQHVVEHLRANQANRGLCPVCHRPTTVPAEVCENPTPGNGQDNQVASVAVPGGLTGSPPSIQ